MLPVTIPAMPNDRVEITSIGNLAVELQVGVVAVRQLAERLGVNARLIVNGVPYFERSDVDLLAAHVAEMEGRQAK